MLLNDAAAPIIRPCIAQSAEDAIELDGLVGFLGEQKFNRIDRNRVGILEI